jgi:hypothetical protein
VRGIIARVYVVGSGGRATVARTRATVAHVHVVALPLGERGETRPSGHEESAGRYMQKLVGDHVAASLRPRLLRVLALVQAGMSGELEAGDPRPCPANFAARAVRSEALARAVRSERGRMPSPPAARAGL